MTNDQNTEFLAQLEIDLKNRYTEQDEEYTKCFNAPMPDPPILKIVFKKNPSRLIFKTHIILKYIAIIIKLKSFLILSPLFH